MPKLVWRLGRDSVPAHTSWYLRAAAAALVAALAAGCTPAATEERHAATTGIGQQQITIDVRPDEPILVEVDGVVTITGPAGAVDSAGQLRVTTVPSDEATPPLALDSVGTGVDVEVIGTDLVQDLALSFIEPPREDQQADLAPALLHLTDEGDWNLEAVARADDGQLVLTTTDFSIRWPAWLNPTKIIGDLVDSATDALIGRSDPDPCTDDGPEWATLEKRTTLVHTCTISNPDDKGDARAEAQLKSNRRFFTLVSAPPGADYVWNEQGSWLATHVAAWLPTARGQNEHLLFPQARMTAGYYQPAVDIDERFTITLDHYTAALSVGTSFIGLFLPADRASWAAVLGMLACADRIPSNIANGDGWWEYTRCLFTDALPSLDDPDKATSAAQDLIGDVPVPDVRAAGQALDSAASKLRLVGKVFAVIGAAAVVRDIFQEIPDAFSQMGADRPGDVRWAMRGQAPASESTGDTVYYAFAFKLEPGQPTGCGPQARFVKVTGDRVYYVAASGCDGFADRGTIKGDQVAFIGLTEQCGERGTQRIPSTLAISGGALNLQIPGETRVVGPTAALSDLDKWWEEENARVDSPSPRNASHVTEWMRSAEETGWMSSVC